MNKDSILNLLRVYIKLADEFHEKSVELQQEAESFHNTEVDDLTDQEIKEYREISYFYFFIQKDIVSILNKILAIYELVQIFKLEGELTEDETKKLLHASLNNKQMLTIDKSKLMYIDPQVQESIDSELSNISSYKNQAIEMIKNAKDI